MATISTTNFAKFLSGTAGFSPKSSISGVQSSSVLHHGRRAVKCSMEEVKPRSVVVCSGGSSTNMASGGVGSLMAAAVAAALAATTAGSAMALVDERMSTEGTGLPFGLSNNLLGWILLGVFGLIWSLYFIYTADLDEDDDSGLSL